MNDETKGKRCKFCGKLLRSEKMPICRHCKLEGRNKVGQVGGIVVGMYTAIRSAKTLAGDKENDDSSSV